MTEDIPHNEADRAVKFINKLTGSDEFVGKQLKLLPWQEKLIRQIFGTFKEDGTRQYRTCFLFLPRKNGKTTLVAAAALCELFSGRAGQQILIVAGGSGDQAKISFQMMETMLNHPSAKFLRKLVDINKTDKRISYAGKSSFIKAMSSEAGTKLGFNPSTVIFDEFLLQTNRELWDTITSGSGTRKDWFTFIISTAGDDRTSPVYDEFEKAKRYAADPSLNPAYLPVLYYATEEEAEGDKWADEKLWEKVNPSFGHTVNLEFLREKAADAKELPYEERIFRQRYLNQFVDVSAKCWIPAVTWAKCKADLGDLHGEPCWGGVDLSMTTDLTAFSLVFPRGDDRFAIKSWAWIPKDTLRKHEKKDHANYWQWVKEGWLTAHPGEAIDYELLKNDLRKLIDEWKPKTVFWDRWGAAYLIQNLTTAGFPMFAYGQGTQSMSQPTKEFERLVLTGRLQHDGNPCLAWNVSNVQLKIEGTELVRPDKGRSTGRIDLVVAGIMALAGAMDAFKVSVYETRGLFV